MTPEQRLGVSQPSPDEATARRIAEFYDHEYTFRYDEKYSTPICKNEDRIVMAHIFPLLQGRVVDIGCGDGLPLRYLTDEEVDALDYHGIDLSPEAIEKARKEFPKKDFRVCNMHHLPFTDGEVDTVLSLYGPFSYSLWPDECLGEFCRVLKSGGHLAIMPYTERTGANHFIGGDGYSTATNPDIPKIFYSTERIQALFARHPFKNITIHGINYFANMVEAVAKKFDIHHPPEFYRDLLDLERPMEAHFPIEYARHALVIAQKSE